MIDLFQIVHITGCDISSYWFLENKWVLQSDELFSKLLAGNSFDQLEAEIETRILKH